MHSRTLGNLAGNTVEVRMSCVFWCKECIQYLRRTPCLCWIIQHVVLFLMHGRVRERRELSEMQVISPILFWEVGPLQPGCCFSVEAGQAMMGELRGYADAASFGHWVQRQNKKPWWIWRFTHLPSQPYSPGNFLNKLSRSQQIEVASLGRALKMLWRTFSWRRRSWMHKTPHLAWAKLSDSEARCGLLPQGKAPTKNPSKTNNLALHKK